MSISEQPVSVDWQPLVTNAHKMLIAFRALAVDDREEATVGDAVAWYLAQHRHRIESSSANEAVNKLVAQGWLVQVGKRRPADGKGRAAHLYRVTDEGLSALSAAKAA